MTYKIPPRPRPSRSDYFGNVSELVWCIACDIKASMFTPYFKGDGAVNPKNILFFMRTPFIVYPLGNNIWDKTTLIYYTTNDKFPNKQWVEIKLNWDERKLLNNACKEYVRKVGKIEQLKNNPPTYCTPLPLVEK